MLVVSTYVISYVHTELSHAFNTNIELSITYKASAFMHTVLMCAQHVPWGSSSYRMAVVEASKPHYRQITNTAAEYISHGTSDLGQVMHYT